MDGTTEVEKCNESDDSNQQQTEKKIKDIANRIRQFTIGMFLSIDTPTSVSNVVNDDEGNNVLVVEKHPTEGHDISRNNKKKQCLCRY